MFRRIAAAAAAVSLLAVATPAGTAPPSSWDGLTLVKSRRFDAVYLMPGADFRNYTKVMLDPTEVAFQKNWLRDYNQQASFSMRLSDADAQRMLQTVQTGFEEIFRKAYTDAGYPIACFFPGNGFYPGGPVPESAPSHAHPVAPPQTGAKDLKVVKVAAPAINCVFNTSCKVTVTDSVGDIPLPGISGKAVLQSRTYQGAAGAPAAGLTGYDYRVDLTQAVGIVNIPCVSSLTVDFGPASSLHYSGGPGLEQVFVITKGGLGSVAPVTAVQTGRAITFTFQPSVCAGSAPGKGDTSFFFGLASSKPPKAITAIVTVAGGAPLSVAARAPQP